MSRPPVYYAKPVVRRLFKALARAGFQPLRVDYGEDEDVQAPTWTRMFDAVFEVDDCIAFIARDGEQPCWLRLIAYNGEDVVSDYNYRPGSVFDTTMSEFNASEDRRTE